MNVFTPKQIAASLCHCSPDSLLDFRELSHGGVVVIAPDGRKFAFSAEQMEHAARQLESEKKPTGKRPEAPSLPAKGKRSRQKPSIEP